MIRPTRPEHIELSERDSLRVIELLSNPPKPNARLRAAAKAYAQIFGCGGDTPVHVAARIPSPRLARRGLG
jgi:hypothetical protein